MRGLAKAAHIVSRKSQRLRALLAHARAGHRIGCVPCQRRDAGITLMEFISRRYDETGKQILDEPKDALVAWLRAVAYDDELMSESQKHSDSRSPVDAARRRGEI